MRKLQVVSPYEPAGDQGQAIKKLSEELRCIRRNGSKKTGYWEIITEDK